MEQIYRNNYSIYNIMFYIVYYGLIGKRYFGTRRRCVSYMGFAPLAPPLYFGIQTMPRSCRRSSTLRSESGKRTYSITAKRMISGLVLKYLNGECFVIRGFYKYTRLASTEFTLTVPSSGGRRFLIAGPAVDDGHICRPTHGPEGWGLRNSPTADECHAWAP